MSSDGSKICPMGGMHMGSRSPDPPFIYHTAHGDIHDMQYHHDGNGNNDGTHASSSMDDSNDGSTTSSSSAAVAAETVASMVSLHDNNGRIITAMEEGRQLVARHRDEFGITGSHDACVGYHDPNDPHRSAEDVMAESPAISLGVIAYDVLKLMADDNEAYRNKLHIAHRAVTIISEKKRAMSNTLTKLRKEITERRARTAAREHDPYRRSRITAAEKHRDLGNASLESKKESIDAVLRACASATDRYNHQCDQLAADMNDKRRVHNRMVSLYSRDNQPLKNEIAELEKQRQEHSRWVKAQVKQKQNQVIELQQKLAEAKAAIDREQTELYEKIATFENQQEQWKKADDLRNKTLQLAKKKIEDDTQHQLGQLPKHLDQDLHEIQHFRDRREEIVPYLEQSWLVFEKGMCPQCVMTLPTTPSPSPSPSPSPTLSQASSQRSASSPMRSGSGSSSSMRGSDTMSSHAGAIPVKQSSGNANINTSTNTNTNSGTTKGNDRDRQPLSPTANPKSGVSNAKVSATPSVQPSSSPSPSSSSSAAPSSSSSSSMGNRSSSDGDKTYVATAPRAKGDKHQSLSFIAVAAPAPAQASSSSSSSSSPLRHDRDTNARASTAVSRRPTTRSMANISERSSSASHTHGGDTSRATTAAAPANKSAKSSAAAGSPKAGASPSNRDASPKTPSLAAVGSSSNNRRTSAPSRSTTPIDLRDD